MATLGIIDAGRLSLIPSRQQDEHEFCFHVHDMMLQLLRGAEEQNASEVYVTLRSQSERDLFEKIAETDPLKALEEMGYYDESRRVALNQVNLALFSDLLHFVHDGLKALELRKFTVALALLRKPLKENLFFAAWACADESEFYQALADAPDRHMDARRLQPSRRKEILARAIQKLDVPSAFSADLIYDILYNRDLDSGLSNQFDKATHLITGSKPLLITEALNLNFIFKSPLDNDVFSFLYFRLAYVLIFALSIQIALYSQMKQVEDSFRRYCLLVALGANHALFGEGRSPVMDALVKAMRELMVCPHCRSQLSVGKRVAARFLIAEEVTCRVCGEDSSFPLFWLLSKMNLLIGDDSRLID